MAAIEDWDKLTDREQETAVSLLHRFRTNNPMLSEEDRKLLSIAADFLDEHRRKFKR